MVAKVFIQHSVLNLKLRRFQTSRGSRVGPGGGAVVTTCLVVVVDIVVVVTVILSSGLVSGA